MSKTLVLIRHAHRDNSRRELDNGLDDKGREQAKYLKRFFFSRFDESDLSKGLWLVSSPKLRCVETLLPIAKELDRPIDKHPGLDEQTGKESGPAFLKRVEDFLEEWKKAKPALTLICSHGDWLPVAAANLSGLQQEFKKGSWLELEWEPSGTALKWYVPSFRSLYE